MSQTRTVLIQADGAGAFSFSRHFVGQILAVRLSIGTLDTISLSIQDHDFEREVLNVSGQSSDHIWQPMVTAQGTDGDDLDTTGDVAKAPPVIIGTLDIAVSGAEPNSKGTLRFVLA